MERSLSILRAQGFGRLIERSKLQHARMEGKDGGYLLFHPWDEWDRGRFLELCILAGCDYLDHIKGVAIKTAYSYLRIRAKPFPWECDCGPFEGECWDKCKAAKAASQ